jgi:tetratricopeptide (TPR) repeat protein
VGSSLDELKLAREMYHYATVSENPQEICWGSYDTASALSRSGQLLEAALFIQRANTILSGERFFLTESVRAATDSYVRLQFSDYKNARRLAEISWQLITKTWCACDYTLLCLPTYIESIIGPNWLEPLSQHDRWLARKILWFAFLLYPTIPNHQPHVNRVHGRACAAMGRPRKAIRHFEAAIRLAEKKKMKYQQARSLLDLAAIKEQDRNQNRSQAIQLLKEMKSVIPRAESWLLGDQYDESVVAPEFDIAAWEREHGLITPQLGEGHHS